jgi:hypothetical protein
MQNNFKTELNATLSTLITQRKLWEDGTYKQANADLYAILEKCGEIFTALREEKTKARAFNAIAEELGIAFNKGTSLALKIVRVVFGTQTNREFAYARVIKIWYDEKADEQTLTNYVIEQGGVENVRRNASNKTNAKLSTDDYRDIAASALTGEFALATINIEDYMLSDKENDTDYIVALVHCDSAGKGKIVYGSNKRGLVNNALAVIGKDIDDLQKQAASKETLDDIKVQKTADMKQFIARALTNTVTA